MSEDGKRTTGAPALLLAGCGSGVSAVIVAWLMSIWLIAVAGVRTGAVMVNKPPAARVVKVAVNSVRVSCNLGSCPSSTVREELPS